MNSNKTPLLIRQTMNINDLQQDAEMSILNQQKDYNIKYHQYNQMIQQQAQVYQKNQMVQSTNNTILIDDLGRIKTRLRRADTVDLDNFCHTKRLPIGVQQVLDQQGHKMDFNNSLKKKLIVKYDSLNNLPLILPTSTLYVMWKFMIGFLILAYFFVIPVYCVYGEGLWNAFFSNTIIDIVQGVVFTLFLLDMCIEFNTAFYHHGSLISVKSKIALNYLNQNFLFDMLSLITLSYTVFTYTPYYIKITCDLTNSPPTAVVTTFGSNSVILHLFFYFRVVGLFTIDHLFVQQLSQRHKGKAIYKLIKIIIMMTFLVQIIACLFYAAGIHALKSGWPTWLLNSGSFGYIASLDLQSQYFFALYFAFANMTTMSYGDILPLNKIEILVAMLAMLLAVLLFAFNIDKIHQTMVELRQSDDRYQRNVNAISRYMRYKYISQDTQYKVKQYLAEYHLKEGKRELDIEQDALKMLGPSLKENLFYEAYKHMLEGMTFFQQFSKEFQIKIASKIQEIRCSQDEIVFLDESNAYKEESIYYIADGSVRLFMNSANAFKDSSVFLAKLKAGQHFGEYSFITGQPRQASAQCHRYTQLYKLTRQDFLEVIQGFEEDYQIFCMIRDRMLFDNVYTDKCFTCGEGNHYAKYCPTTHYVPLKEDIIQADIAIVNKRHKVKRSKKKRNKRIIVKQDQIAKSLSSQEIENYSLIQTQYDDVLLEVPPPDEQNYLQDGIIGFDKSSNYRFYYPNNNLIYLQYIINNR